MVLMDFHEHQLVTKPHQDHNEKTNCDGCGLVITGTSYVCPSPDCCVNLHIICARLPSKLVSYKEHPHHPLELCRSLGYPNWPGLICDVCDKHYPPMSTFFFYHCRLCGFDVDLICAALTLPISHQWHKQHQLQARLSLATSFSCSACGGKHEEEGIFFRCLKCPFWLHDSCFLLPQKLMHQTHHHVLSLGIEIRDSPPDVVFLCAVCNEQVTCPVTYAFYRCKDCSYYIHVKCLNKSRMAGKEDEITDGADGQSSQRLELDDLICLPAPDVQSLNSARNNLIKRLCQTEEDDDDRDHDHQLQHIGHHHPLILFNDQEKNEAENDERCDACILPISGQLYYGCCHDSCNFYLHKWCAALPNELRNCPCHFLDHPMQLTMTKELFPFGFFKCKGCWYLGNGFAYKCVKCKDYCLCVRCASLPRNIKHETHEHSLTLKQGRSAGACSACRFSLSAEQSACNKCMFYPDAVTTTFWMSFGCDSCFFALHADCAFLPRTIRHRFDEQHPFVLSSSASSSIAVEIKEMSAELFCEFCESKEDIAGGWYYGCRECNMFASGGCLGDDVGLFSLIKYGGRYDSPYHSEHSLGCAPTIREGSKPCDRCGEKDFCGNVMLGCDQCKVFFHLKCAYMAP
ncbi:uncharacterized protein LOC124924095 isoform X2 [Impatiens glandulifera]|uniref:uncharacterized protein LOC124924095 isoform X2 n=1 Tax=Impatiens glandulifera TaxID=253017 RepID=UPI001FB06314|nr:uncharacterized protein LOC124924095 isoform X2 [Impatiens glandulifera]XP_047320106.1 uncharacterized protein LOC124924095 isoform X2 [Impatiens glandulifera]